VTAPVIDAHLHLWDLASGGYSWLTPDAGALHATFRAADAEVELGAAHIDAAVLVQADDTEADTDAMLRVADENEWVAGVVGWVQLDDPAVAEEQLDRRLRHAAFRGVRHLVHDDPRDDFLELATVRRSLGLLAEHAVPFDVPDAWPRHLAQVTGLAADIPALTVVLDHLGKPPRGRDDLPDWRTEFERLAALPNTVAKVSGLRAPGAEYSADALRDVWELTLEAFGPERMMWGSDWPMTVPDGGYGPTFDVLAELVAELDDAEADLVLGGTATRVYGLDRAGRADGR
jgi:L-fuconolactonase